MTDVKSKRPTHPSRQSEISSGAPALIETAPTVIPEDPPAPQIVLRPPAAAAEPMPEVVAVQPAAAEQPGPEIVPPVAEPPPDSVDDPWTAFTEAQAVLARGFEEVAVEVTGMTRSGMAAAADAGLALLGVRTCAEAVEINASLARRGVEAMIEGSARLSEIGVKAVSDAARPLLSRFA
jgi:hypothetical protein